MKLSIKVMLGEVPALCLVVATLALGSAAGDGPCERRRTWWDRERGACAPCTRCEPQLAVKLPCELHRDTICQPLHEIHIWPFDTQRNDSELSDYEPEYYDYSDYGEVSEDEVRWDVQTTTLTLAASGCVLFFVLVLYLSFYHSKQWKVLKKALRSDVQDLSAKLKLMEAGETPAEPVVPSDHHIYCNIHVAKDPLLGPAAKKGLGNVYTQEKHPS
ncbi:tumor necrosis factor receptor superfamily member wengen [Pectinophora gossypiella]|uniref:tumor necrosis factor receptor superfamily member wengen n=1 Tax=Pectinophora gossypiella TaxID=13191 RepID=UPI00214F4C98|nr:tumor necrosis factor receptor superfamily member wengen [Pectinophora gossypiella]